jgi:hypothetical protein
MSGKKLLVTRFKGQGPNEILFAGRLLESTLFNLRYFRRNILFQVLQRAVEER